MGRRFTVSGADGRGGEPSIAEQLPDLEAFSPADQQRLRELHQAWEERGFPEALIRASLRSAADLLREWGGHPEPEAPVSEREAARKFLDANAAPDSPDRGQVIRGDRRRDERDRIQTYTQQLLREARLAHGRHEIKKTRNMLLKLDQRELRRVLGNEGDELCRQINTWLRTTASMF